MPPHLFAVSDEAYRNMINSNFQNLKPTTNFSRRRFQRIKLQSLSNEKMLITDYSDYDNSMKMICVNMISRIALFRKFLEV